MLWILQTRWVWPRQKRMTRSYKGMPKLTKFDWESSRPKRGRWWVLTTKKWSVFLKAPLHSCSKAVAQSQRWILRKIKRKSPRFYPESNMNSVNNPKEMSKVKTKTVALIISKSKCASDKLDIDSHAIIWPKCAPKTAIRELKRQCFGKNRPSHLQPQW